MRYFLVINHTTAIAPFQLNSLTNENGRIDVIAHLIKDSFLTSNGIRRDTTLFIYMAKELKTIRMEGSKLRSINPDERSIAAIINALFKQYSDERIIGKEYMPGITLLNWDLKTALQKIDVPKIYLSEKGNRFEITEITGNELLFILSDNINMDRSEEDTVMSLSPAMLSLSPVSLHSNQCIVIVHYLLDNMARL